MLMALIQHSYNSTWFISYKARDWHLMTWFGLQVLGQTGESAASLFIFLIKSFRLALSLGQGEILMKVLLSGRPTELQPD